MLRALVLDFDGVLVESNHIKTEAFRDVCARFPEHGERMMAYHRARVSSSRYVKFTYLVEELLQRQGDQALVEELADDFSRRVADRVATCRAVDGAEAFLVEFSGCIPLLLASITPEPELCSILERRNWMNYFDEVFGYPPRTKNRAVERAVALADGALAGVALIGDSSGDLQVAHEEGIEFIGRDSGLEFPDPKPCLYKDMNEIGQLIRERVRN